MNMIKQKQPTEVFYKKNCFYKFRNIHRKTTVFESLFNKVAGQHRCFPVDIANFLRTSVNDCF